MTMDEEFRRRLMEASSPPGDLLSEPGAGPRLRQQGTRLRRRHRLVAGSAAAAVVLLVAGVSWGAVALTGHPTELPAAPVTPQPSAAPVTPAPSTTPRASSSVGPTTTPGSPAPQPSTTPPTSPDPTVNPVVPPPATATTPPPTSPSALPTIMVYGDCTHPSTEPSEIVMECGDYGLVFGDLRWTSWTSTQATATGTLSYKECIPSCGQDGRIISIPNVHITLTTPVPSGTGVTVWSQIEASAWPPGWPSGPQGVPTHRI